MSNRRTWIEELIARNGDPVVVDEKDQILGKTLQIWEPGLPFVLGAVMRVGTYWYFCEPEQQDRAIESGDVGVDKMTKLAIQLLRERLLTGWQPTAAEIDRDITQIDAVNWSWAFDGHAIECTVDGRSQMRGSILFVSAEQDFALTTDAFIWLLQRP